MTQHDLHDEFYDWCKDYLPPDYADELAAFLVLATEKYKKYQFAKGMFVGFVVAVLLMLWLS